MKHKSTLFVLMFALFVLVACSSVVATGTDDDPAAQDVSGKISVANCVEAEPGTKQLIYAAQGVCFLYPDNYEVFQVDDGSLTLYVDSLLNTEAPLASIQFKPLEGRSIQEVIPDYPSDAESAAMSFLTIDLGEEMATVLDNLPGQDINRRVIALHEGRIIDIMIARFGPEYGVVGKQAEALYTMITDSFQFIGIEPEAQLLTGSN
jgi:hypothetical protein